jgi:hypothetical protein
MSLGSLSSVSHCEYKYHGGLTKYRIKNPLIGIPKEQLIRDVEAFAAENDLQDIAPWLIKGALVAQSPHHIDNIQELDSEDARILHEEVRDFVSKLISIADHRNRIPTNGSILEFFMSLSSSIQLLQPFRVGIKQVSQHTWRSEGLLLTATGSNGANLTFAITMGISDDPAHCATEAICNRNSWLVGFVNSSPYIAICLLYVHLMFFI